MQSSPGRDGTSVFGYILSKHQESLRFSARSRRRPVGR